MRPRRVADSGYFAFYVEHIFCDEFQSRKRAIGSTRNVQILNNSVESLYGRRHFNCQNQANLDTEHLAEANSGRESEHPDMDYLASEQLASVNLASADFAVFALVAELVVEP